METVINLIPSNYKGDPRKTLAYCWQDYDKKIPGHDVAIDISNGVDWKEEAKKSMKSLGVKNAFIHCFWGGNGIGGSIEIDEETPILAGDDNIETGAVVASNERIENTILSTANKSHPGWCDKCKSYCYGDCQTNIY